MRVRHYWLIAVIAIVIVMTAVVAGATTSTTTTTTQESFTPGIRKTYRPWVRHWRIGFTNMYSNWHKYFMAKMGRLSM